jgi:hypothetical protein
MAAFNTRHHTGLGATDLPPRPRLDVRQCSLQRRSSRAAAPKARFPTLNPNNRKGPKAGRTRVRTRSTGKSPAVSRQRMLLTPPERWQEAPLYRSPAERIYGERLSATELVIVRQRPAACLQATSRSRRRSKRYTHADPPHPTAEVAWQQAVYAQPRAKYRPAGREPVSPKRLTRSEPESGNTTQGARTSEVPLTLSRTPTPNKRLACLRCP